VWDPGKRLEYFPQKWLLLNFSPGVSQLIKMAPSILKNTVNIIFLGGYRMHHSCRNFAGRYASYLPMIIVLEKPRLVTCPDITEADSLLAFRHPEEGLESSTRFNRNSLDN
jgi:hypothetical protein